MRCWKSKGEHEIHTYRNILIIYVYTTCCSLQGSYTICWFHVAVGRQKSQMRGRWEISDPSRPPGPCVFCNWITHITAWSHSFPPAINQKREVKDTLKLLLGNCVYLTFSVFSSVWFSALNSSRWHLTGTCGYGGTASSPPKMWPLCCAWTPIWC